MAAMQRGEAVRRLCERIKYADYAHAYAEPGYDDPEGGVIFANWNDVPAKAQRALEHFGCALEWSDEWSTCSECGRAVRTQPDCWPWHPSYVIFGGCELLCRECAITDPDEF